MKTREEYIDILRSVKSRADERLGLERIGIFGSVARGEARPDSDLDVFVETRSNSYNFLQDLKRQIEAACGCAVDFVHIHKWLSPLFLKRIERDGIVA